MSKKRVEVDKTLSSRIRSQFAKDNKEMDEVYERKSSHGDFHFKGGKAAGGGGTSDGNRHKRNVPLNKDSMSARPARVS